VNLAQVNVLVAIEPHAQLSGRHIEIGLELRNTVFPVLFLALDDQIKVVLGSAGAFEHGNVDGIGFRLVGRSLPHAILRARLKMGLRIAVILDQALREDLNGLNFFGTCLTATPLT